MADKFPYVLTYAEQPRQYFNAVIFFSELSYLRFSNEMLGKVHPYSQLKQQSSGAPASTSSAGAKPAPDSAASQTLPIDAHRDTILRKIEMDRVTIIHGETGTPALHSDKSLLFIVVMVLRRVWKVESSPCYDFRRCQEQGKGIHQYSLRAMSVPCYAHTHTYD
jgi:hypothetical protein